MRSPPWTCAVWIALFGLLCRAAAPSPAIEQFALQEQVFEFARFEGSPNIAGWALNGILMSFDEGASWTPVPQLDGLSVENLEMDPFVGSRAFAFTNSSAQYYTADAGRTWRKFELPLPQDLPDAAFVYMFVEYNHANSDYLLFGARMHGLGLEEASSYYYSSDGLKSPLAPVPDGYRNCVFARANADFDSRVRPETVFCSKNTYNSFGHVVSSELIRSTDFFRSKDVVDSPQTRNTEIIHIGVASAFMTVSYLKDKFSKEMYSLLVSKDAQKFQKPDVDFEKITDFGSGVAWLNSLRSDPSSLRFGLVHQSRGMVEDLFFSDSTGLKFTRMATAAGFTVRNYNSVDGVWFGDIMAFESSDGLSMYSVDDAKTWHALEIVDSDCKITDGCSLQLSAPGHFGGNVEIPTSPNILVAMGYKRKDTEEFHEKGKVPDTYVSRDGGRTWKMVFEGPHASALVDQGNILVMFPVNSDSKQTTGYYSLNQGLDWEKFQLPTGILHASFYQLGGSAPPRVILMGVDGEKALFFKVDFANIYGGATCGSGDMEDVVAVISPEGSESVCVKGQEGVINRRKAAAECLVSAQKNQVSISFQRCQCTAADYECSPFFRLSDKNVCVPDYAKIVGECRNKKSVELPQQQKIAGNQCVDKAEFISSTKFDCAQVVSENGDAAQRIDTSVSVVDGYLNQYSYVQVNNATSNILVHTSKNLVYASNNGGVSFVEVDTKEKILFFMVGAVAGTAVLVAEDNFYYSTNGGNTFTRNAAPGPPSRFSEPLVFDPNDANKFIYVTSNCAMGAKGCEAFYTEDAGNSFRRMHDSVVSCLYVDEPFGLDENRVFCTVLGDNGVALLSSSDYFQSSTELLQPVVAFAIRSRFVFVAVASADMKTLGAKVTSDGATFADAEFPADFTMDIQTAYTLLNNNPASILMHLTTDNTPGRERGAILKSNSNGTSYVLSLADVNRDAKGYVDFDTVENLDGVMLANTVSGSVKSLQTRITFSDGSQWHYLTPPPVDSEGNRYACSGRPSAECSLHLHGFTERPDFRDTFSSASAVGFLIGVGSVGASLDRYDQSSTFLSTDGGVSWREVAKGVYMWEYGDRGTILVLVRAVEATDEVLYSTDDGASWTARKFTDQPVRVMDLATVPSDTARKFVLFAEDPRDRSKTAVHSLDFSNYYARQCQLDMDHPLDDDFDYWTPVHPHSDGCLFGHEKQFLRRAPGHYDCFVGAAPLADAIRIVKNCTCTRDDYECDYNYVRDADGTCKLIHGLRPQDKKAEMCAKPDAFEYFQPTGYRKIPLSTCVGGKALDVWDPQPCPGHEKEFNKKHGRNLGVGRWLLLVLVPLAVFLGATWFVYEKGIKRNGGFSRLGQIRLDDDGDFQPIEENGVDVAVNRVVRGGVLVVAACVAVMKMVVNTDRKILENAARILIGRRPGRRNYVRVPDDEDELFGDFDENSDDDLAAVDFAVDADEFSEFTSNTEPDAQLFDIDDEESRPHTPTASEETHEAQELENPEN